MYYLKICSTFETAYGRLPERTDLRWKRFKNIFDVTAGSPQSGSEHAAACGICHFSEKKLTFNVRSPAVNKGKVCKARSGEGRSLRGASPRTDSLPANPFCACSRVSCVVVSTSMCAHRCAEPPLFPRQKYVHRVHVFSRSQDFSTSRPFFLAVNMKTKKKNRKWLQDISADAALVVDL